MIRKVSRYREEMADREAIRACIYMFCRAQDMQDEALLEEAYWPGAIDDHVQFVGPKEEFVRWVIPRLRTMEYIKHMVSNIEIELDGAEAKVESYYQAISGITGANGIKVNVMSLGIYRDRFERRDDEWRIAHRVTIHTPPQPASPDLHFGWFASGFAPPGG